MTQPTEAAADEHLSQLLLSASSHLDAADPPDILTSLHKGEVPEKYSWFETYRHEFFRMLAFSEHECYDHPVACLFVVHSHAEDAVKELQKLQTHADLPPLMQQGLMEPDILSHCIMLHDGQSDASRAEDKLRELRSMSGCACTMLKINSVGEDMASGKAGHAGLWRAHFRTRLPRASAGELPDRPDEPEQGLGAALSSTDLESIASTLQDFTVRYLLPHLELRIRALNQQVLATRKGLRNQLKGLLWRGKSGTGASLASEPVRAPSAAGPSYGAASVEGQMRALADVAFIMQDYELAASTLRVLSSDLKADKAWKHYAGAQEMLALASFMSGAAMSDVIGHFREAYARYTTAAQAAREPKSLVKYATRTALLLAEYSCSHRQFTDAHLALMRAHFQEDNLRAALLLEQAALFELHTNPSLVRKFAFHTVLAGLRYNNCKQQRLGMHAYRQVLPIYRSRNWVYIEEHLHDVLGKQLREAGELTAAAHHFQAQLPCVHNHENFQAYYLRQFLDTVQEATAAKQALPAMELPVPVMDLAHVLVRLDDQICHADVRALSQPRERWRLLEGPLTPASDASNAGSWLDGARVTEKVNPNAPATIVADEHLTLTIPIHNPMAVPLTLSRLRLACTHDSCEDDSSLSDYIQVEEVEIELAPLEQKQISLSVRPLQPGMLNLQGVAWTLNDVAPGFKAFPVREPTPTRRSTGGARLSYVRDQAKLVSHLFNIVPAMPRLEVKVTNEPAALLQGQLRCCHLLLRNTGATPLKAVRVSVQHPDVLLAPPSQQADLDPLSSLSDSSHSSSELRGMPEGNTPPNNDAQHPPMRMYLAKGGVRVHSWPAGLVLGPGEVLNWRMWLHPRSRRPLLALFAWSYEATSAAEGMQHRLLRMTRHYDVLPSLEVTPSLLPSHGELQRCLLRLDLNNSQGLQPVQLCQVACSSPGWRLCSVASTSMRSDTQPPTESHTSSREPPTPHTAVPQDLHLPAGFRMVAFFHLYTPTHSGSNITSGVRWMEADAGPLPYFQARPVRITSRATRETRQTRETGDPGALQPVVTPFAAVEQAADAGADILAAWRTLDSRGEACMGAVHMLECRLQEGEGAIRAVAEPCANIRHDFRAAQICVAPLLLRLRNCLPHSTSVSVEAGRQQLLTPLPRPRGWQSLSRATGDAEASASDAASQYGVDGPAPAPDHIWCGHSCKRTDLNPGQQTEVHLQVAVFAPGIYEVTDYAIAWASTAQIAQEGSTTGPAFFLTVEQS